jgi:hypothetical protein
MNKLAATIALILLPMTSAMAQQCAQPNSRAPETVRHQNNLQCPARPPYHPLSTHDKFNIFLHRTYSPFTVASGAFNATWAQMTGQWYEYGGGMQGWGKRFGASLADSESRTLIQTFALSSLLHQDPRYFPSEKKRLIPRAWYAATRVLITKSDKGTPTFNSAEILGAASVSALENAYYPEHDRGWGNTFGRFVGAVGSDATTNLLREFWPDIKKVFRKHEPKKLQDMEKKIPLSK